MSNMTKNMSDETTDPSQLLNKELVLKFIGSQYNGKLVRLKSSKCSIGSAPGSTLRLNAPSIKPVQCVIERGPSEVLIRSGDPSSLLNGSPFESLQLSTGDELAFGPIKLGVQELGLSNCKSNSPQTAESTDEEQVTSVELSREMERVHGMMARSKQLMTARTRRLVEDLTDARGQIARQEDLIVEQDQKLANFERTKSQLEKRLEQLEEAVQKIVGAHESQDLVGQLSLRIAQERSAADTQDLPAAEELRESAPTDQQDTGNLEGLLRENLAPGFNDVIETKLEQTKLDMESITQTEDGAALPLRESSVDGVWEVNGPASFDENTADALEPEGYSAQDSDPIGRNENPTAPELGVAGETMGLTESLARELGLPFDTPTTETSAIVPKENAVSGFNEPASAQHELPSLQSNPGNQTVESLYGDMLGEKADLNSFTRPENSTSEVQSQLTDIRVEQFSSNDEAASEYDSPLESSAFAGETDANQRLDHPNDSNDPATVASLLGAGAEFPNMFSPSGTRQVPDAIPELREEGQANSFDEDETGAGSIEQVNESISDSTYLAGLESSHQESPIAEGVATTFRETIQNVEEVSENSIGLAGVQQESAETLSDSPATFSDQLADLGVDRDAGSPPEALDDAAETVDSSEGSEEESIEEYMAQLLQRVRGGEGEPPELSSKPASSKKAEGSNKDSSSKSGKTDLAEAFASEIEDGGKEVPKSRTPRHSAAPERRHDLAAMRELANCSARSAIETSQRRQAATAANLQVAGTLGAFLFGLAMLYIAPGILTLQTLLGLASLGASGYLGYRSYDWFKSGKNGKGEEGKRKPAAKQPSANSGAQTTKPDEPAATGAEFQTPVDVNALPPQAGPTDSNTDIPPVASEGEFAQSPGTPSPSVIAELKQRIN